MSDDGGSAMTCTCGRLKVGSRVTEARNWNPDCVKHGTDSDWYRSPEQRTKREQQNSRLLDLQRRAREAREQAQSDDSPTGAR